MAASTAPKVPLPGGLEELPRLLKLGPPPQVGTDLVEQTGGRLEINAEAAAMLDEGTSTMTSQQLPEARETLGASISASGSVDRSTVYLSALSPNPAPDQPQLPGGVLGERRPPFRLPEPGAEVGR